MTAGRCSPEMADAIVKLLLNDGGSASVYKKKRSETAELEPTVCSGCGLTFLPSAFGRQYCSRSCYDQHLARLSAAKGKVRKKPPKPREPGVLGPGRRLPAEVKIYLRSRRHLASVRDLVDEVHARFGLRLGVTTVYRVFRRERA